MLQAGLSGVRFLTETRHFFSTTSKPALVPTDLPVQCILCAYLPIFPGIAFLGFEFGVELSAGHRLMLRLIIIMIVLQVPHLPALTLVTSRYISVFDFTSETCCVTYTLKLAL